MWQTSHPDSVAVNSLQSCVGTLLQHASPSFASRGPGVQTPSAPPRTAGHRLARACRCGTEDHLSPRCHRDQASEGDAVRSRTPSPGTRWHLAVAPPDGPDAIHARPPASALRVFKTVSAPGAHKTVTSANSTT